MASDVTVGGQVQYEFLTDFGTQYITNTDAELTVKAVVDDYNSAKLDWEAANDTDQLQIDESYFTTEWGKYLGTEEMGVTITTYWGYNEWMNAQYADITGYAKEEVWDFDSEDWQVDIDVGIMDIVHLEYAVSPGPGGAPTLFGVYGGMDPVHAEVYVITEGGDTMETADVGIAVNFGMDIAPGMFGLEVAVSFMYDLDKDKEAADDYATGRKYLLGAAIATDIIDGMAYVNLGFNGDDENIFKIAFAELGVNYQDMVGADLGVGLTMDGDQWDETLDQIEVFVWVKPGASKFGIGYLLDADQTGIEGAPGNYFDTIFAPDDSMYDPVVSESGVIYFSGTLDF
jgi:hypothetical protein